MAETAAAAAQAAAILVISVRSSAENVTVFEPGEVEETSGQVRSGSEDGMQPRWLQQNFRSGPVLVNTFISRKLGHAWLCGYVRASVSGVSCLRR